MTLHEKEPRRRWCWIVKLGPDYRGRLEFALRECDRLLKRWAQGPFEVLFSSSDARDMGFVFVSELAPEQMRAQFEQSEASRNGDAVLFVELGEAFLGVGFGTVTTWLQRN
jgi:hypothetical protein